MTAAALPATLAPAWRRARVVIVAPYPRTSQAHGEESAGGVASYTKNLVTQLRNHADVRILAPGRAHGERENDGVAVHDVPTSGPHVARAIEALAASDADVVHVQFEQHLFGGASQNLRLVRALRRLSRAKRVIVTVHQVPDLDAVDRRFLKENAFPPLPAAAKAWMRTQYRLLAHGAHALIVHSAALEARLVNQYGVPASKVHAIPHGVERHEPEDQATAKARLGVPAGKKLALYFGYVTGYKGVDLLVEALEGLHPEEREALHVVIAGKAPDRKLAHRAFREKVDDLEARIAALAPFVERKGFLSHDGIVEHLAAADVVVFPYRHVFAASGPLSIALGHGRPAIATEAFRGTLRDEALFATNPCALREKLREFLRNPDLRAALEDDARRLREEHSWERIGARTAERYVTLEGGA